MGLCLGGEAAFGLRRRRCTLVQQEKIVLRGSTTCGLESWDLSRLCLQGMGTPELQLSLHLQGRRGWW